MPESCWDLVRHVKGVFLNVFDLGCSVVDQHLQAGMGDHEVYDELTDYWDDGSWGVEAETGHFFGEGCHQIFRQLAVE